MVIYDKGNKSLDILYNVCFVYFLGEYVLINSGFYLL